MDEIFFIYQEEIIQALREKSKVDLVPKAIAWGKSPWVPSARAGRTMEISILTAP